MAEPIRWQDRWWHQQPDGTWLLFNEETQTWEPYSGPATQPVYAPTPGLSTGAKWAIGIAVALVALLIVSILAAIAIPVFLRQREKAWIEQSQTALKNAAMAQESHCMASPECYTTSISDLDAEGLSTPRDVELRIVRADRNSYCIEARHRMLPNDIWSYDSQVRRPQSGPCF